MRRLRDVGIRLYDCDHRTPQPAPEGYPYIAIPNVRDGRLDLSDVRLITELDFHSWTRRTKPQAGDIILTRRARVGDTAVVPPGLECAIGQNLVILRSDGTEVEQSYLRWALRGPLYWQQVRKHLNEGAVFSSLNCRDIPSFEIPLPPRPVQIRIADILGTLDDKIECNRRVNKTLEGIVQTFYKHWFVEFGPYRHEGLYESTVGHIPVGWTVEELGTIAEVVMGASPAGDTYNETGEGVPLINGPVEFGDFFPVEKKWTTAPTRLTQKADLIFCVRGSTTGRRVIADGVYCLGRGVCAIRALAGHQTYINKTIDNEIDRLLMNASGSVFPNLSGSEIRGFKVLAPPPPVVGQFCAITQPFVEQTWLHIKESETLANTRDYLLPKLLSGEIEVKAAEEQMEALV